MGGIARVGQIQLLQPFITFAIAAFINREEIGVETIVFAAAVAATVVIGLRTRTRLSRWQTSPTSSCRRR